MSDNKLLSLVQLNAFTVTARERYLKKAADSLGISASAVSQTIKSLETFIGTPLFVHESRPLKLTAAGRRLLILSEEILKKNDQILASMQDSMATLDTLRLGLGESAAGSFGPWVIAGLEKKIRSLEVLSGLTKPMVKSLNEGKIDILLSPHSPNDNENLNGVPLLREDYVLVVKRGSPALQNLEELKEFIASRPLIEYNAESSDRIQGRRLFRSASLDISNRISVSTSYLLVGLICQLDGWSLITPTDLWTSGFFLNDAEFRTFPGRQLRRTYWMSWQKELPETAKDLVLKSVRHAVDIEFMELMRRRVPGLSQFISLSSENEI